MAREGLKAPLPEHWKPWSDPPGCRICIPTQADPKHPCPPSSAPNLLVFDSPPLPRRLSAFASSGCTSISPLPLC